MVFAFRVIVAVAIQRLHAAQDVSPSRARHGPRYLSPGARMLRVRAARRRPHSPRTGWEQLHGGGRV